MGIQIFNAIVTRNIESDLGIGASSLDGSTGPNLRGGIYFQCAQLLEDMEYPIPALPMFPHEFFSVPNIEDTIEIEIDLSDDNPQPRWRCVIYNLDDDVPEEFQENYPNRRGLKTKAGHYLYFDDKENQLTIKLLHAMGTMFEFDKDGNWLEEIIKNKIIDIGTDEIKTIGNSQIIDIATDKSEMIGGNETILTTGTRTHTAASHILESLGTIQFGSSSATENLILGLAFMSIYNAHLHIGNLGAPTSSPMVPMSAAQLSTKHFTEI